MLRIAWLISLVILTALALGSCSREEAPAPPPTTNFAPAEVAGEYRLHRPMLDESLRLLPNAKFAYHFLSTESGRDAMDVSGTYRVVNGRVHLDEGLVEWRYVVGDGATALTPVTPDGELNSSRTLTRVP